MSRASLSCYGHWVLWWLWLKKKRKSTRLRGIINILTCSRSSNELVKKRCNLWLLIFFCRTSSSLSHSLSLTTTTTSAPFASTTTTAPTSSPIWDTTNTILRCERVSSLRYGSFFLYSIILLMCIYRTTNDDDSNKRQWRRWWRTPMLRQQ